VCGAGAAPTTLDAVTSKAVEVDGNKGIKHTPQTQFTGNSQRNDVASRERSSVPPYDNQADSVPVETAADEMKESYWAECVDVQLEGATKVAGRFRLYTVHTGRGSNARE